MQETTAKATRERASFRAAFESVNDVDKRRAFIMLGAAGVTFAVLLLSRIFQPIRAALDGAVGFVAAALICYLLTAILFVGFSVALDFFIRKHCGVKIFAIRRSGLSVNRALGAIAVGAVAAFIAGASLGFSFKLQLEMGLGVTIEQALINISVYIEYGLRLWMGFVTAALVQRALDTLIPTRYTMPWGAIFLVAVFGTVEFALEAFTTAHSFPLLYYLFTYAYACVFVLTERRMQISFWASLAILVL